VNKHLIAGVAASALVVGAVMYLPPLRGPFASEPLSWHELAVVLGLSLVPLALVEAGKGLRRRRTDGCGDAASP